MRGAAAGRRTILIAQHSMTDVFKGAGGAMHAAVLYNRDRRFAGAVLDLLRAEPGLIVGDNEPYFVSDETDYSDPAPRRGARPAARRDRDPPGSRSPRTADRRTWAQRLRRGADGRRTAIAGRAA